MKLVPFSRQYLKPGEPLPFGLRDAGGRLLLAAGVVAGGREKLETLFAQPLYADAVEAADWYRRLAAAMHARVRQNATLREVAAARPDRLARDAPREGSQRLAEVWAALVLQLDGALRELAEPQVAGGPVATGAGALERIAGVHERAREWLRRRPDGSLYLMVYEAGHGIERYSAHHALLVMAVCEQAASWLDWAPECVDTLGRAALLMNVAMVRLQDDLALTRRPLTPAMRAEIDAHAEASVALLKRQGVADELLLDVVRRHHDGDAPSGALAGLPVAQQIAQVLRRVDVFTAKISRRAARQPMSPVVAAREACLGGNGQPDEIGGALLKAVGLYPPGSYVELASGEIGIVVARGRRANLPIVASLVSPAGTPIGEPALRDTIDRRFAVRSPVPLTEVRVRPVHEKLLALR